MYSDCGNQSVSGWRNKMAKFSVLYEKEKSVPDAAAEATQNESFSPDQGLSLCRIGERKQ